MNLIKFSEIHPIMVNLIELSEILNNSWISLNLVKFTHLGEMHLKYL